MMRLLLMRGVRYMSEETTTLIDNLNSIKNSKLDIKQALVDKRTRTN